MILTPITSLAYGQPDYISPLIMEKPFQILNDMD